MQGHAPWAPHKWGDDWLRLYIRTLGRLPRNTLHALRAKQVIEQRQRFKEQYAIEVARRQNGATLTVTQIVPDGAHKDVAAHALASALHDHKSRVRHNTENPMSADPGEGELMAMIGIGHALLAVVEELRRGRELGGG